ncbi:MAG: tetratricopeptide repeat protein [Chloroflexota bacterium]|nr:tetratricopeptide repeat protein [Chloroflexota bacterium]PLS83527.1 MAG: protein-glutamate O-methyltransferase [Chloroflexota bacterium]
MRPTLSTGQFHALANRIAEYSGFMLDGSRHRSLESALAVRMQALAIEEPRSYLAQLDTAELQRITELVVNHETQFFRTPAQHRALREDLLPRLHRDRPISQPLRCWSAGCATGEEPYSLAISMLETLGQPSPRPVEIYATDISTQALAKAQAGTYRGRAVTNVAPAELKRHFVGRGDMFEVRPDVRALVRFEQHNLQAPLPAWAPSLDIISCQNVTIYFAVETCRALMARFFDALVPGGYLFLGFSETLWRIFDRFETLEVAGAFVYRKPVPRVVPAPRLVPRERPAANRDEHAPPLVRRTPRPDVPQPSVFELGMAQLEAGAFEPALQLLQQIRPTDKQYPQALAAIARIHANRGEWELAAVEARRALELDLLTHDAHLLLGMLAANQQRWDRAVVHLERVRYLDPRAPLPSFHLANAYRGQGRLDLAEREYRSALRKLGGLAPSDVLDGVSVAWLRETCQRLLQHLDVDRLQQR